jgi:hypothetical protein
MNTYKFTSDKVKKSFTTEADCVQDAAVAARKHFAGVIARREYGRSGYCRTMDYICEGRVQAFIGRSAQGGGCSGHSVIFDVDLVD